MSALYRLMDCNGMVRRFYSQQPRYKACGPSHSCGAVRNRYIRFNPAYSKSSLYVTMNRAIATPLFLITSLQPLCFHAIVHAFYRHRGWYPPHSHHRRPLVLDSPACRGRPLFSYSYELLFPQLVCFDNHPHCPGPPTLDAQTIRLSDFQTVRGTFRPSDVQFVRSATWTRRAHPTIIAASS